MVKHFTWLHISLAHLFKQISFLLPSLRQSRPPRSCAFYRTEWNNNSILPSTGWVKGAYDKCVMPPTPLTQGCLERIILTCNKQMLWSKGLLFVWLSLFYSAIYSLRSKMSDCMWLARRGQTCHSESLQTFAYKLWVGRETSDNMHLLGETLSTIIFGAHRILPRQKATRHMATMRRAPTLGCNADKCSKSALSNVIR